jgi:GNAT superfamily N-acetyltransferase
MEQPGDVYVRRDFVAVEESNPDLVIGYSSIWPQGEARFRMDLIVAQDSRRRGVGSALFETLQESLRVQNATIVEA